jgi:NAD(P)-dependent dehydrogenase (short-subunit alcohol dehydrogenase family)
MNILIIGGTKGIGRETAVTLARNKDNRILVTGRNSSSLIKLSNEFDNISTFQMDLSNFDSLADKFRKVIQNHFETVDILINMAGLLVNRNFMDMKNTDARLMMETNFFGPASIIRVLKPYMKTGSHIVNISSMGGFQGSSKYTGLSYYSASKAAIASLSECLAEEFRESGVSVNCLALGAVNTEMLRDAFPGYNAPVESKDIAGFIAGFAITGHKFFNGKILPVALNNP